MTLEALRKQVAEQVADRQQRRIMRPAATALYLGISRTSLWRWVRDGNMVPPIRLGPNAVGFDRDEVDALIASRRAVLQ